MNSEPLNIAIISMHTSPMGQPGTGDSGGMNVYVREMASALARMSCNCFIFTRASDESDCEEIVTEPGVTVFNIKAGPDTHVDKEDLINYVDEFYENVKNKIELLNYQGIYMDVIHANYWLSGLVGHKLKHYFELPLIVTFHTLDRVKAEFSPEDACGINQEIRQNSEKEIIKCADILLASCEMESTQLSEMYGANMNKIKIVPLGINHAFFCPGNKEQAKNAIGCGEFGPLLVFVGRIQPLKGLSIAAQIFELVKRTYPAAGLLVVGGPSGHLGYAELEKTNKFLREASLLESVVFLEPQPHEILSTIYRAADICVVPSSSESFGLVALEAMSCGTLTVASAVGGLNSLVVDGYNGYLVDNRDASEFANKILTAIKDSQTYNTIITNAIHYSRNYTWKSSALKFMRIASEVKNCVLIDCS